MRSLSPARLLALGLLLACGDNNGPAVGPYLAVTPVLDSLYVGDVVAARSVTYFDAQGNVQSTGPVHWSSSDSTVARIDTVTGELVGRAAGAALISARANGITGSALVVVSRTLDLALLLDTLYLMPGDTITVPVSVRRKGGNPPPVTFSAPTNGVFTIDPATGKITATGFGGPITFIAHADIVTASGAVEVVQLTDTLGGKGFYTVLGTVIRHDRSGARGVNYRRTGDTATFRISLPVLSQGIVVENMLITLRDSVYVPALFGIDSISPNELSHTDPVCRPPRPWALWSLQLNPPLRAVSRANGGTLSITQVATIAHGRAISGRFEIPTQRTDFYEDPLGALPIRGTFVAPLIDDPTRGCR